MKREKFEVRGALAATVEGELTAPFDKEGFDELFAVINEAETRFFGRARAYAQARADTALAMSASERRRLKCERIMLDTSVVPNGELLEVTFSASISCGRDVRLCQRSFLWDNGRKLIVDGKKQSKKQNVAEC